ncbi:DsbA family protein [Candidatus Woesearchaeota archaeon]|nr:DsbA family protein [Candidatus Woesearchaeota archaeon]
MEQQEQQKEQQKKPASDRFWKFATVALIVVLAVFVFRNNDSGQAAPTGGAVAVGNGQAPTAPVDMKQLVDDDAVKGDANAPVTIVEFSDYECPFCARFYEQTLSQINEKYIKTGKVKFVYRDFPLSFHPQAQKAAEAAECAGEQGKYYEMHDLLFEKGVQGGVAGFKQYAQELGLDTGKFNSCLDSGQMAAEIRKDMADGAAAGVQGTPGFFVNGIEISGAQPFEVFQQVIDAALAQ